MLYIKFVFLGQGMGIEKAYNLEAWGPLDDLNGTREQNGFGWGYCKTRIVRVPFISRPWQPRENNGSLIYILAAIS